jgi:WD40 repeat protein
VHPSVQLRIGSDFLRHAVAQSAAFSPDGTLLATGGSDVRLWDLSKKRLLRVMPLPNRFEDGDVLQMRFSPDGKTIYVRGSGLGHVTGFDVASGKRLFRFQPDPAGLSAFDISPDGKVLATASGGSGEIVLWTADTKEKLRTVVGHQRTAPPGAPQDPTRLNVFVQSLAFSPDGKWLASRALYDDSLRVFDVETGKEKHMLECPSLYGARAVFSPDGYLAAYRPLPGPNSATPAKGKPALVLWDVTTGKVHQEFDWVPQWGPGHHDLAFSADGKWMAGDRGGSRICVWERATGKVRFTDPRPISPCGTLVFSKDANTLVASESGSLEMWDLRTGRSLLADGGHIGMIRGFDLSSDGTVIATGGTDATIRLWDARTGTERHRIEGIGGLVVFSPDGRTLLTGSGKYDGEMILWDAAEAKEVRRFRLAPNGTGAQPMGVNATFSIDGKTLLVASNLDLNYHLFDVATGKGKRSFSWNLGLGLSTSSVPCRLSPDGKHFAGLYTRQGADFVVALWDMTKPGPQVISGVTHVVDLAFSADGEYLAWSDANEVNVWDVRANRKLMSFKGSGSLAFSPDGRYLAAGKTLHPLNPKHPTLVLPVQPGYQAFTRDGTRLVVVPLDQAAVLVLDVRKLDKGE